jgi:hypothetical protein
MIPLCTTATSHFSSVCGCALRSVGGPCVAQRVWGDAERAVDGRRRDGRFEAGDLARRLAGLDAVAVSARDAAES